MVHFLLQTKAPHNLPTGFHCSSHPQPQICFRRPNANTLRGPARLLGSPRAEVATPKQQINLSQDALKHLKRLREDNGSNDLLLRVGVKSGGCSGMSYTMDFEDFASVADEDTVVEYEGFKLVTDPMSLLYLYGMTLDYSNKLIGGGFIFQNPNAQSSCGCGKSFGV